MDKDETPIGGLSSPLQPTKQLFYVSVIMDLIAVMLSFFIGLYFVLGILLYIIASRAYSYRGIRLKRFPVAGFLTVFIFQGALVFFLTYHASGPTAVFSVPPFACFIASLLIGALYPLTQIYQHEEDKKDGVVTISYLLGKKGTFILSMILFLSATFCIYLLLKQNRQPERFYLFICIMLPVVLFFLYWMIRVFQNEKAANFRNSLLMNVLATICTTAFFIMLIILNH